MNHEKTTLEMIAPTIEEAVERGANQLGISKDELSVEVLNQRMKPNRL
jgi:predicted RNA-binding protein Jag